MDEKRSRKILLAFVVTSMLLTLVPSANGWGPTGHRVVAEIAQRHLTPAAQARVSRTSWRPDARRRRELARRTTLRPPFR